MNAGPKDGLGQRSNKDTVTPATNTEFKRIAAKYRTKEVDYRLIENDLKKMALIFPTCRLKMP